MGDNPAGSDASVTSPTSPSDTSLGERLGAWSQNSPDPDFFRGDTLSAVLDDCGSARDRIEALEVRNRELEAGLRPFAALADDYLGDTVNFDDDTIMAGRMTRRGATDAPPRVLFADFRRARALLPSPTGDRK